MSRTLWRIRALAMGLLLAAGPLASWSAAAEEAGGGTEADPSAPALDQLLRLPAGSAYGVERRGGLSRGEWRARFSEIETALATERKGLAEAEAKLDEAAAARRRTGTTRPIQLHHCAGVISRRRHGML